MADKRYPYIPHDAVPPGMTIEETIDFIGMSREVLAQKLGLSEQHLSELIEGTATLTPEIAEGLERILDTPASFWNTFERNYRELLAQGKPKLSVPSTAPA